MVMVSDSESDVRGFKAPSPTIFFSVPDIFLNYNIHDISSILRFHNWSDRFYLYFL